MGYFTGKSNIPQNNYNFNGSKDENYMSKRGLDIGKITEVIKNGSMEGYPLTKQIIWCVPYIVILILIPIYL